MKQSFFIIAAAAILAAGACSRSGNSQQPELQQVDVAYPTTDSVTIFQTYPGKLVANREVTLMARVDGNLMSKDYASGALVKKGSVLFRIEDRNYRDAVARAQAALAQAKANREYAATRYSALAEALKGDAVSEIEVAQAKSTLSECEAAVKDAAASLQTAETQLSYCTIRAPFDGHITTNSYDVGSYIPGAASPVALATIYEDNEMIAEFSIEDNATLSDLRRNYDAGVIDYHNIPLKFSETLGHDYTGDLYYFAPDVNTSTGTLALNASVGNPYDELRSGMFVTIDLPVASEPRALLISDAAISTDQLGKYVYVVNDSNRVVYTPIETGQQVRDSLRIVTKGLSEKDRYVTKALLKVRDGIEVKPVLAR